MRPPLLSGSGLSTEVRPSNPLLTPVCASSLAESILAPPSLAGRCHLALSDQSSFLPFVDTPVPCCLQSRLGSGPRIRWNYTRWPLHKCDSRVAGRSLCLETTRRWGLEG